MGADRRGGRMLVAVAIAALLLAEVGVLLADRPGTRAPRRPALVQSIPLAVIAPPAFTPDPPPPPPPSAPLSQKVIVDPAKAWAVLVGVQHYDAPTHPTFGALGDVAAFHRVLTKAGWADSHILVLTDQAATGGAIRRAVTWLTAHAPADGFALFHYSGHVQQSGGHEYLWGVDNDLIPNDQFGAAISDVKGRAWIDVAGCESAGFDVGVSSPSHFFSSSSMVTQKSYEVPTWAESVWTGFAVDQGILQSEAGAAPSIQAAVRWAQKQAPMYTSRQEPYGPQVPYAVGGDGEWFLGPAVSPPSPSTGVLAAPAS
ncbi:MAG: hypothetical protein NVSMB12_02900 [Acidimicrobiales bacterium]